MTNLVEPTRAKEGLISEFLGEEFRSVETYDSTAGALAAMTLLGKQTDGALTAAKTDVVGANKGVIALAGPGYGVGAQVGKYQLLCIESYNAVGPVPAVFSVTDPHGNELPALTAGAAYANQIALTKAVGTADAVGDEASVTITEAAGGGNVVPLNPTAVDGSQNFYGINLYPISAGTTVKKVVTLTQFAVVSDAHMTFPAAATVGSGLRTAIIAQAMRRLVKIKSAQVVAG
jgi:hypothetical protein